MYCTVPAASVHGVEVSCGSPGSNEPVGQCILDADREGGIPDGGVQASIGEHLDFGGGDGLEVLLGCNKGGPFPANGVGR